MQGDYQKGMAMFTSAKPFYNLTQMRKRTLDEGYVPKFYAQKQETESSPGLHLFNELF